MSFEDDSTYPASTECANLAPILVRAAVETLTQQEQERVAAHVIQCESCRREAMELGDLIAGLRTWDASTGAPSRHFSARLKSRLAREKNAPAPNLHPPLIPAQVLSKEMQAGRSVFTGSGATIQKSEKLVQNNSKRVRRSRFLVATLALSVAINFAWLLHSWMSPVNAAERPIVSVNNVAARDAASPVQVLQERLNRLRLAQDSAGLVDGDPVATAWWLIAESRAKVVSGNELKPVAPASIELAQRALATSPLPSSSARTIVATGLRESVERLGVGSDEAVKNALNKRGVTNSVTQDASLSFSKPTVFKQMDSARSNAKRLDLGSNSASNTKILDRLASGDVHDPEFIGGLFTELSIAKPELAFDQSLPNLNSIQTTSFRAEALCAVATASILPATSR